MKKKYIWYGKDEFDIKKLKKIEVNDSMVISEYWDKPKEYKMSRGESKFLGCFWASPVDTNYGWKDWCEDEQFNLDRFECSQTFTLKETANICTIDSMESLKEFMKKYTKYSDFDENHNNVLKDVTDDMDLNRWFTFGSFKFDWNKVLHDYDGMEISHDFNFNIMHNIFNTWDCDSICIWNPDIIELNYKD